MFIGYGTGIADDPEVEAERFDGGGYTVKGLKGSFHNVREEQ